MHTLWVREHNRLAEEIAAAQPDLKVDEPNAPMTILPRPGEVAITGLYYFLPIVILIWNILVERLSPTLSAYWATIAMIIIATTPTAWSLGRWITI